MNDIPRSSAWFRRWMRPAAKPALVKPPFRRKLLFEALEPRVLLSADITSAGVADSLNSGLHQLQDKLGSFIQADTLLNTALPLITRVVGNPGDTHTVAAKITDLFNLASDVNGDGTISGAIEISLQALDKNADGTVDFGEALGGKFTDRIGTDFLGNISGKTPAQFISFLDNLDGTTGPLSLRVDNVTDQTNANQVGFEFDLNLSFSSTLPIDLGTKADSLGLNLSANLGVQAALSMHLGFGVLTSGEAPAANGSDFFLKTGAVTASVTGDINSLNAGINIGFLGAQIQNGSVHLSAGVKGTLADPTAPTNLGFTEAQFGTTAGSGVALVAANAPGAFKLDRNAEFALKVGTGDTRQVRVTVAATADNTAIEGLVADVQAAIDAAGFASPVTAGSSAGKLTLTTNAASGLYFDSKLSGTDLAGSLGSILTSGVVPTSHVDVNLPIKVSAGIAGMSLPVIPLSFSGDPFSAGTPGTDTQGNSRFDLNVDFSGLASDIQNLTNFNEFNVSNMLGTLGQLKNWLDGLKKSSFFRSIEIAKVAEQSGDRLWAGGGNDRIEPSRLVHAVFVRARKL